MVEIKQATLDHLTGLASVFDAYRVWYRKNSDQETALKFLEERIKKQESVIYIAVENDEIIGFTQLYPLFSSTRMKRLWLLNDLFLKPAHRGKGISKQLINAAKDLCRSTDGCGIMLETENNNDIGNKLYPSVGFELNSSHNFYEWTC